MSARDASERTYDIHGIGLRVIAEAAEAHAAIDRRLQSFRTRPTQAADLRMEFLVRGEGEDSRVPPPPGPARPVYEAPGGEIHYQPEADTLYAAFQGVRLRCQAGAGVAVLESRDFSGRALYLATHALATVCLIEMFKRRGRFNLHAACLAHRGRGLLLAGPSGVGKSTLALALVRAGLSFLSDDMVYIERLPGGPEMLSFPDAVGITQQTAERFPELSGLLVAPAPAGFPKRLVRMGAMFETTEVRRCVPHVLIFPALAGAGATSRLEPLDPQEALLRLVPDVLLTQPSAAQAHLAALADLLEQVGCHLLLAGPDVGQSVDLITELL